MTHPFCAAGHEAATAYQAVFGRVSNASQRCSSHQQPIIASGTFEGEALGFARTDSCAVWGCAPEAQRLAGANGKTSSGSLSLRAVPVNYCRGEVEQRKNGQGRAGRVWISLCAGGGQLVALLCSLVSPPVSVRSDACLLPRPRMPRPQSVARGRVGGACRIAVCRPKLKSMDVAGHPPPERGGRPVDSRKVWKRGRI
jgi:hypothetical protein